MSDIPTGPFTISMTQNQETGGSYVPSSGTSCDGFKSFKVAEGSVGKLASLFFQLIKGLNEHGITKNASPRSLVNTSRTFVWSAKRDMVIVL